MKEIYKSYLSEAPDVYLLEEGPGTRQHTKILEIFTEMQIIYDGGVDKIDFRDWLTAIESETKTVSRANSSLLKEWPVSGRQLSAGRLSLIGRMGMTQWTIYLTISY